MVEVESGAHLWSRELAEGAIVRVAFTPDGSELVATVGWAADTNQSRPAPQLEEELGVHRFDARTGNPVAHLPVSGCGVVTSPEILSVVGEGDKLHLITESCGRGEEGEGTPFITALDLTTGETDLLSVREGGVHATPDGSLVLVQGSVIDVEGSEEGSTLVINRATGKQVAAVRGWPIGISADGSIVLTALYVTDQLATWDVGQPDEPMALIDRWEGGTPRTVPAWLSPDGSAVARVMGTAVELFDARTGELENVFQTGLGSMQRLSFSADGSRFAIGEVFGGTAAVFDQASPSEVGSVKLCENFGIQSAKVDVRGDTASILAACEYDDRLATQFLVDPISLELNATVHDQSGLHSALSSDGRFVATQLGRTEIRAGDEIDLISQLALRDTSTGQVVRTMHGLCEWVEGDEPSPDCVDFPGTPYPDWPWQLVLSSDGSLLAMAGDNTDAVVVWDTESGEIVGRATVTHNTDGPGRVLSVAFSPSGDRLAASFVWTPKELWLISTDDWKPVGQYVAPPSAETIEAPSDNLLFTPDGETLIGTDFSAFGEGRIVFMDANTLDHLDQISDAHQRGIADLALNHDGTLLASAGIDGVVRIWDVVTRSLVHEIPVAQVGWGVGGVDFVGNGRQILVTALESGELHMLTTDTEELLAIARPRITRGLSNTECDIYHIDPCPTLAKLREG